MISDSEIRKIIDVTATTHGVLIKVCGGETLTLALSAYQAFRFSMFLDRALLDYVATTGHTIDEGFAR